MTTAPKPGDLEGRAGDEVLGLLAERVGGHADARMVYGDPVTQDGVTVVPVAQVRWGFGIGSGFKDAPMRTGGGGAVATPVGYLELRDGTCRYVALRSGRIGAAGGLVGAAAFLVAGRLLGRRRRG